MNVDDMLLLGRVLFVAALYLFLIILAFLLRRELRSRASTQEERAPGDLIVMEAANTGFEAGERIPLLAVSSLGRDSENDIVLDDAFVSSEHAKLIWNGKGWVLQDLGSTNGTSINGKRVKRAAVVQPGDTLQLGSVKLKLAAL